MNIGDIVCLRNEAQENFPSDMTFLITNVVDGERAGGKHVTCYWERNGHCGQVVFPSGILTDANTDEPELDVHIG